MLNRQQVLLYLEGQPGLDHMRVTDKFIDGEFVYVEDVVDEQDEGLEFVCNHNGKDLFAAYDNIAEGLHEAEKKGLLQRK